MIIEAYNTAASYLSAKAMGITFLSFSFCMIKGVIPDLTLEAVIANRLHEFDRNLFGINEMPEAINYLRARKYFKVILSENCVFYRHEKNELACDRRIQRW